MASTNKTAHIELSQYVANDKPTYLGDYNADMLKIDTAVNGNKVLTETAQTTADTAIANAENAQSTANTAVTNSAQAQASANLNASNIGTMANLETTDKTSLVEAINEVNTKASTSEVVDSLSGEQVDKAPSVNIVKQNIDDLNEYKPKVLWTNSNPTSDFSSQTINLSSNDYDMLVIICQLFTGDGVSGRKYLTGGLKGSSITLDVAGDYAGNIANFERTMARQSDTAYNVGGCSIKTATGTVTSNSFAYPVKIIGIKLT